MTKNYYNNISNESCLAIKPPENYHLYFTNLIPFYLIYINNTLVNIINSKYYNIMQTLKEFNDKSSVFLFYLNTCSLEHLVQSTKTDFDIISVSESRLIKDKLPLIDTSLPTFIMKSFQQKPILVVLSFI